MLIPNQYSLAEANQLVPLLESSLAEIAAMLVELHRARLSVKVRARASQPPKNEPESLPVVPLAVEPGGLGEAASAPDALDLLEVVPKLANATPGQSGEPTKRHEWPVGIPLGHVVSPPSEVAHAILEAAESENFTSVDAETDPDRALRALLRSAEEFEACAEDIRTITEAEAKIQYELDLLQRMGVFVHSMDPPTVHLLSHRGSTPVLLSWRPGEPAFMYWHSLDWGTEERAPIDDPELFGGHIFPC